MHVLKLERRQLVEVEAGEVVVTAHQRVDLRLDVDVEDVGEGQRIRRAQKHIHCCGHGINILGEIDLQLAKFL